MKLISFGLSGLLLCAAACAGQEGRLTPDQVKKLKNPIPYSKKSIADGRLTFVQNCTGCHGNDGKAQVDVIANATDLTSPKMYKSGTSEGEIFRSIRDGAGETMPPFRTQLSETEMWNLVNYVRNLWPQSMRPPLQDSSDSKSSK